MNIIEVMEDPALFGDTFGGGSWANWRALIAGFYALPLSRKEKRIWQELTGRTRVSKQPYRELWLTIGRRGGKSIIAALLAVYEAVFNEHESKLAPGEVATIMVIASDRKQARTVMRYISGLFTNQMLTKLILRENQESIELANRCVIEVMTASHRATRGYTVACVIADEIAFWYSDGANPDREIINAVRPSLATLNGKLIALSSPYARRGVLWDAYRNHYGTDSPVLVAKAPTLTMNPTLDPQIVKTARVEDPSAASAEYDAEFRTDVESYVAFEILDACTRPSYLEIMPDSNHTYIGFVDPSGGSHDAMTLCISHKDSKSKKVIVNLTRSVRPPFSPEGVVEDFSGILKRYRVREVHGDAYAGEWPREQFSKRGIRYKRSEKNKSEIYKDMLPLLNSEAVELPPDKHLYKELQGLERRTSRGGRDSIDHAPGAHDDLANAVAGACVFANLESNYFHIPIEFDY